MIAASVMKGLRVVTVNFQSVYNKKDEINPFLIESDVGIVLGSEKHLSPSINIAEILPQMCYLYRRDRADSRGGVIIITKKNLTAEEVKINKEPRMVVIMVEACQKPVIFASCYRPPKNTVGELLFGGMGWLTCMGGQDPIWVGGDFSLLVWWVVAVWGG